MLLMGLGLAQAGSWLQTRGADLSEAEREFIKRSLKLAKATRAKTVGVACLGISSIFWLMFYLAQILVGYWSLHDFALSALLMVVVPAACTIAIHFGSRFAAYFNIIYFAVVFASLTYGLSSQPSVRTIYGFLAFLNALPYLVGSAFAVYATSSVARLGRGPASPSGSPASPPALVAEPVTS